MKSQNPDLGLQSVDCIKVFGMLRWRIIYKYIKQSVRHFELDRQFKIRKVKIQSGSEFIVKIGSFKPEIYRFFLVIFFLACKVIPVVKAPYYIWSDIIQPVSLVF